ncbi:MFS transporter [Novosphingobium panipatense]
MFTVPFWGRFVDRYGARVSASIGFIAMPASFIAFSFMTGDIYQFFAITVFQNLFGVLTTTLVFTRVVIQKFDAARGMALSVLMSGPP